MLYHNATSFSEYIDVSTLSRRILSAAYCLKGAEKSSEYLMNAIFDVVSDIFGSQLQIQCPGTNYFSLQSEMLQ